MRPCFQRHAAALLAAAAIAGAVPAAHADWGGFSEPQMLHQRVFRVPVAGEVLNLIAMHLDGDGIMDVLTLEGEMLRMYKGLGEFTYRPMGFVGPITASPDWDVRAYVPRGDFDGNGFVDVLLPSEGGAELWLNQGDYTFVRVEEGTPTALPARGKSAPAHIGGPDEFGWIGAIEYDENNGWPLARSGYGAVDFDGDGDGEIALPDPPGSSLVLWDLTSEGVLVRRALSAPSYLNAVAMGDINEDGSCDVVFSGAQSGEDGRWYALFGNGDGSFGDLVEVGGNPGDEVVIRGLLDMNGDGSWTSSRATRSTRSGSGSGTARSRPRRRSCHGNKTSLTGACFFRTSTGTGFRTSSRPPTISAMPTCHRTAAGSGARFRRSTAPPRASTTLT